MKTKNIIMAIGLAAFTLLPSSCRENEFGEVDLTMPDDKPNMNGEYTFNHPCAMYSQADFDRVKTSLDNGTAPAEVKQELQELKNSRYSMLNYEAEPQTEIVRGDPKGTLEGKENYAYAMRDAAAAYQTAMLWKLTGNEEYAKKSIEIMDAWAAKCQRVTSNDPNHYLAAGCQGYTFANAAEIMQTYNGWSESKKTEFKNWMVNVFSVKNRSFLDIHTGPNICAEHCWSNWDLVNMCSYLAIGILTENSEMINYTINYFYGGSGNGCVDKLIQGYFADPMGTGEEIAQNQESGRDQGHAMMSAMVTANLAQMTYTLSLQNPKVENLDLFKAKDNAILKMAEYVALTNLRNGTDRNNANGQWLIPAVQIPFNTYNYCVNCSCKDHNHSAVQTQVADDSGRGSVRPGWEIYYNHYKRILGLGSGYKYVQMFAEKLRPECGVGDDRYGHNSGAFDQLGWGTLMLYQGN